MRKLIILLGIVITFNSCNKGTVSSEEIIKSQNNDSLLTQIGNKKLGDSQDGDTLPNTLKIQKNTRTIEDIKSISIVDYSRDARVITVTEITSDSLRIGPIYEDSGNFFEIYQEKESPKLLRQIISLISKEFYSTYEKIGSACGEQDYYIGITFNAGKPNSKNITFVNHYSEDLKKIVNLINEELQDSLKINYNPELINNCK